MAPQTSEELAPSKPEPSPAPVSEELMRERILDMICTCYDPEIPVNIYELGLIYDINLAHDEGEDPAETGYDTEVRMTLTSPMCPVAGILPGEVQQKVASVTGVRSCHVELVWDPPWTPQMMSESAKLQLGFF